MNGSLLSDGTIIATGAAPNDLCSVDASQDSAVSVGREAAGFRRKTHKCSGRPAKRAVHASTAPNSVARPPALILQTVSRPSGQAASHLPSVDAVRPGLQSRSLRIGQVATGSERPCSHRTIAFPVLAAIRGGEFVRNTTSRIVSPAPRNSRTLTSIRIRFARPAAGNPVCNSTYVIHFVQSRIDCQSGLTHEEGAGVEEG